MANTEQIKEITEQIEQGVQELFQSDMFKNYLDTMSKFYNYSFGNCLLIAMQRPDATRVAGFKAWNSFNRHVRKGEKGIKILAPCPVKFTKEEDDGSTKEVEYMKYRAVHVFDISQTDGEDLPEICNQLKDGDDMTKCKNLFHKLMDAAPVPVEIKEIQGTANGYYSHLDKKIVIARGLSSKQNLKTLIHEIGHAIMHNKEDGTDQEADRNTKEVQAESVAYTVCNALGIDSSDYSFGYIAGWSAGKELKELKASLDTIQKTSKKILGLVA